MDTGVQLIGLTGEYAGKSYPLMEGETLIGRGDECALQIADALISHKHAILRLEGETWVLEDLDSTHGTFVKGDRVEKASLQHGDTITIGETILRFEHEVPKDAIPTEKASPDDSTTEIPSQDDIATVLGPPDYVPTQMASPDDQAKVMAFETGDESADAVCDQCGAALTPDQKSCDVCGAPRAGATPGERRRLPWKRIAIIGGVIAALLVVAVGLVFLPGLLSDQPASIPASPTASDDVLALTLEAQSLEGGGTTPLIPPTMTPTLETKVTSDPGISASVAFGGAAQLAFASDRTGRPQIYLIDLDTLELRQLTDVADGACQPAWSPDGSHLAYTSPCNTNREEYTSSSILLMDVDLVGNPGAVAQLIVTVGGGDYDPVWSRDGTRIAFTSRSTGRPQIFSANPDGSDLRNLNDDLAYNWAPTWSNDGTLVAFLTGRGGQEEIWTVPASGGEEQRFSRSDGNDVARPDWSPDGATIVFEKIVGNIPRLIAAPVAKEGVRELQVCQEGQLSVQPMGEPTWSPDGAWLAFETWPDGVNHEIGVMRASCSEYAQLTSDPGLDFDAAWRPAP